MQSEYILVAFKEINWEAHTLDHETSPFVSKSYLPYSREFPSELAKFLTQDKLIVEIHQFSSRLSSVGRWESQISVSN